MNLKKASLLIFIILTYFFSCSDDGIVNSSNNLRPQKITFLPNTNDLVYYLNYDSQNRLTNIKAPSRDQYETLSYNNSKLSAIDFSDSGGNYTFEYGNENKLVRYYYRHNNIPDYIDRTDIEYNNNQIIKNHYSDNGDGFEYQYNEVLTLENGNIVRFEDSTHQIITEYEYSSNPSAFANIPEFDVLQLVLPTSHIHYRFHFNFRTFLYGKNQLIKWTDVIYNQTLNFECNYNENGLPTEILTVNPENGHLSPYIELSY